MSRDTKRRLSPRRAGLTLIELVMVLIIITALAAMVIPLVDQLRRTTDKATASSTIANVASNVGMYRTMNAVYPAKMDSLMEGDGTANSTTPLSTLPSKMNAGHASTKVSVQALTAAELDKVDDMFGSVMQHDTAAAYRNFQGDSGVNEIAAGGGGQSSFIVITNTDIIDSVYPNASVNPTGVFPNLVDGTETGQVALSNNGGTVQTARLICLGVGPSCEAVGKTLQSAPHYTAVDGLESYNRFICMFAVYTGFTQNKRPQLKGALDSTGDFLNQEIIEVFENNVE